MPCEDTGLTVGLKPGLTIALAARTASGTRGGIAGIDNIRSLLSQLPSGSNGTRSFAFVRGEAMSDVTGDEAGKEKVKLCHE